MKKPSWDISVDQCCIFIATGCIAAMIYIGISMAIIANSPPYSHRPVIVEAPPLGGREMTQR
jgi:hypothetical protein